MLFGAAAGTAIISRKTKKLPLRAAAFVLAAGLGALACFLSAELLPGELYALADGETVRTVTVTAGETVRTSSFGETFYAEIGTADGKKVKGGLLVGLDGRAGIRAGDMLELRCVLSRFPESENGFPEERYRLSQGCFVSAEAMTAEVIGKSGSVRAFFGGVSERLRRTFLSRFDAETSGFLSALLLGRKDGLSAAAERNFRAIGGSHLFAVSGLHVGILLGAVLAVLLRIGTPRRSRTVILTLAAVLFTGLTGFSHSAVRAALMLWLASLGDVFGHDADPVTSLSFAGFCICVVSPTAILDIGLEMSFAAAFGILTVGVKMIGEEKSGVLHAVWSPVGVCLAALTFTLPLSWLYFGEISVLSPLTSVLSVLPVPAVMISGVLLLALAPVPFVGPLLTDVTGSLAGLCLKGAAALAFPGALIPIRLPALLAGAAAVVTGLILLRGREGFLRTALPVLSGFAVFAAVTAALLFPEAGITEAVFVSAGDRDCIAVTDGGQNALLDVSDGSYAAYRTYFSERRMNHGTLILTHYHRAHISLVRRLAGELFTDTVFLPYPEGETEEGIAARIEETGVNVTYYRPGEDVIPLGEIGMTVTVTRAAGSSQPLVTVGTVINGEKVIYAGGTDAGALTTAGVPFDGSARLIFGGHGPGAGTPPDVLPASAVILREEKIYVCRPE